jgi:glutathione peroxidase
MKAVYPFLVLKSKLPNQQKGIRINSKKASPLSSFYQLKALANNGKVIKFKSFEGRKVLLVNTASDCGYTAQYKELQELYEMHRNDLVILAFPANDFKEQEKGSDEEIAQFCRLHYGVMFPIMQKSIVKKGGQQNEVFEWLTHKSKNGWNDNEPQWNFCKYLVNEQGLLTHIFNAAVSPLSKSVLKFL